MSNNNHVALRLFKKKVFLTGDTWSAILRPTSSYSSWGLHTDLSSASFTSSHMYPRDSCHSYHLTFHLYSLELKSLTGIQNSTYTAHFLQGALWTLSIPRFIFRVSGYWCYCDMAGSTIFFDCLMLLLIRPCQLMKQIKQNIHWYVFL